MPVAVVIQEGAAGAPPWFAFVKQAGLRSHIGGGAVTIVFVEDVLATVGDEKVVEAVVVVIAHTYAAGPACSQATLLFRYVSKGAVAVIFVESIGRTGGEFSMRMPQRTKMSSQPSLS